MCGLDVFCLINLFIKGIGNVGKDKSFGSFAYLVIRVGLFKNFRIGVMLLSDPNKQINFVFYLLIVNGSGLIPFFVAFFVRGLCSAMDFFQVIIMIMIPLNQFRLELK